MTKDNNLIKRITKLGEFLGHKPNEILLEDGNTIKFVRSWISELEEPERKRLFNMRWLKHKFYIDVINNKVRAKQTKDYNGNTLDYYDQRYDKREEDFEDVPIDNAFLNHIHSTLKVTAIIKRAKEIRKKEQEEKERKERQRLNFLAIESLLREGVLSAE